MIENYLTYIGRPNEFAKVPVEHFINLQSLLAYLKTQGVSATDREQWLYIAFEMISANMGHMDIRRLRDIYADNDARNHMLASFTKQSGRRNAEEEKKAADQVKEGFKDAQDYVELERDAKKPEALLSKVGRAIETLMKHKDKLVESGDLHPKIETLADSLTILNNECKASRSLGSAK